ncbi:hypothetical protein ACFWGN_04250 [Oerskovia sp. NPDC060338]|uniref:hypothetical protein n=1 Tax=Oerskovia sp. NPDC060338 TaxID=3347100 RepID=UPI00364CBEAE
MTPGEARLNLAAALGDIEGASVHPGLPDRFTPPALVVEPADPWIDTTNESTPNTAAFRFKVRVIAGVGTPAGAESALDILLAATITALLDSPSQWSVETVSAPGVVTIGEAGFLSADITVSAPFPLA